jgi:hypothetical protein
MHWTTYRHIPGDAPEKAARPQARQPNSVLGAAGRRYRTQGPEAAPISVCGVRGLRVPSGRQRS